MDAFVNYLTGMEYKDNWRWKLVDESHLNKIPDGQSKTSDISVYCINDVKDKFNIKIIDSPGFGDTAGIKADDMITQKFEQLFREIPEIDYILLAIKSSETRLKHGSKYIYDRVQNLFGKNAKDRFILMCTFADDKTPNCL
jgi:predicted GTPase